MDNYVLGLLTPRIPSSATQSPWAGETRTRFAQPVFSASPQQFGGSNVHTNVHDVQNTHPASGPPNTTPGYFGMIPGQNLMTAYPTPYSSTNQSSPGIPQWLSDATHDVLMRSGNKAYTELFAGYLKISAELNTMKQTYNDIINVLPQVVTLTQGHLNPGINPPLPKKEDHPLIKNWTKSEHDKSVARDRATSTSNSAPQRGKQKASDDPSDKTDFLENEFGEPVSTSIGAAVREKMRQLWQTLANKNILPPNFSSADNIVLDWFRNEMYKVFPWLILCEHHWKINRLWKDHFPGWLKARTQAAFKVDAADDVDAADNMQTAELRIDVEGGNGVFSNSSFANTLKRKRPSSSGKTAQKPSKRGTRAEKENGRVDEDGMDTSDVDLDSAGYKIVDPDDAPPISISPQHAPSRAPSFVSPLVPLIIVSSESRSTNMPPAGAQVDAHPQSQAMERTAPSSVDGTAGTSINITGPRSSSFSESVGNERSQHTLPAQGLTASLQIPILPEVAALDGQVERTVAAPSTADNSDDAMGFRGLTALAIAAGRRGTEIGNTIGERAIVSGERQLSGGPPGTLHETTGAAAPAFATGSTFSNHAPTTGDKNAATNTSAGGSALTGNAPTLSSEMDGVASANAPKAACGSDDLNELREREDMNGSAIVTSPTTNSSFAGTVPAHVIPDETPSTSPGTPRSPLTSDVQLPTATAVPDAERDIERLNELQGSPEAMSSLAMRSTQTIQGWGASTPASDTTTNDPTVRNGSPTPQAQTSILQLERSESISSNQSSRDGQPSPNGTPAKDVVELPEMVVDGSSDVQEQVKTSTGTDRLQALKISNPLDGMFGQPPEGANTLQQSRIPEGGVKPRSSRGPKPKGNDAGADSTAPGPPTAEEGEVSSSSSSSKGTSSSCGNKAKRAGVNDIMEPQENVFSNRNEYMKYYKNLHSSTTNGEFKKVWDSLDEETKDHYKKLANQARADAKATQVGKK